MVGMTREKLSTPFLAWGCGVNLRRPSFRCSPGTLIIFSNCDQILLFREESRIPRTIVGYQVIGDAHHRFFTLPRLNIEDKTRVEIGGVEKVFVPKHDMVRSIVLPHRLCTVRT